LSKIRETLDVEFVGGREKRRAKSEKGRVKVGA